jgi:histidine triad (HIT) family protein
MAHPAYDDSNIFAKILRGEVPSFRIYEDEHTLVFMDIMPRSPGHALIVPKTPSRNLLDADPATLGPLMEVVQKIAIAAKHAFEADGIMVAQFSEQPAGQTIFHFHFHVIPRFNGVALLPEGAKGDMMQVEANARKLRAALGTGEEITGAA